MNVGELRAILRLDTAEFDRRVDSARQRLNRVGDSMIGIGKKATLFATAPILLGFTKLAGAASNLNESVNAVNVVFGDASDRIHRFARGAAREAGLSMRSVNELVTPIGAQLRNVGFGADEAADASVNLAKRAADMASVFNVDVSEALAAIQAGLRGEADPLERFGVGLSAAAVEAKALELGLAGTAAELTDNQKAQARLALLMEQTDRIAGDFTNTSDQVANAERIAAAEAENLAASFGQTLLPIKLRVIQAASSLLDWFRSLSPQARNMGLALAAAAAAIGPLLIVLGTLVKSIAAIGPAITLATGPVGIIVAVLAALGLALVGAYRNSEAFRDIVNGAFQSVRDAVGPVVGWLGDRLRSVGEFFGITRQTVADEVTEMSNEAVGQVVEMVAGMTDQARMMALNGQTLSAEMADQWIANVHKMRDDSITAINTQHAESVATAQKLHDDLGTISAEQRDQIIADAGKQRDDSVAAAQDQAAKVIAEIERQKNAGVAITREQAEQIVAAMEDQRDDVIAALTDQRHQSEAILAKLKVESGRITLETAATAIANSAKQRDETVAAANTEYDERVAAILALKRDSDTFTQEMADAAIAEARRQRDDTVTAATDQHLGVVVQIKTMRDTVVREVDIMTGEIISDFDRLVTRLQNWSNENTLIVANVIGTFREHKRAMQEWVDDASMRVGAVVGFFLSLPGRVIEALSGLRQHLFNIGADAINGLLEGLKSIGSKIGDTIKGFFNVSLPSIKIPFTGTGDGDGMPVPSVGGTALNRVRSVLSRFPGARITSSYRTPEQNRRAGGVPNSYHLDPRNPAVDIGGPTRVLDQLAGVLRRMGGWRELLWRTKGHYDHIHVAHRGGTITESGLAPLRRDERLILGQVGETVLPRGASVRGGDGVALDVQVFIGDRELTDIVDVRITERGRAGVRDLRQTARSRRVIG